MCASLKENTSDSDTLNVADLNARLASVGDERGHTDTKNDSIGFVDFDGIRQVVVSWLDNDMQALVKL